MKRILGNLALSALVFLAFLALAEVGLRALTPFPIHGPKANKIYDRDAGYRLYPGHPNIDQHGFRNRAGKPREIAAIGDSHTFGSNVKPSEAWPEQFEQMTGKPVYNYGVGSYAVYAHFANAHRALDKGSKYIIIALLIHNDFKVNGNSCDIDFAGSPFWQDAKQRLDLKLPDCSEADNWATARSPGFIRYFRGRGHSAILSAFDYLVVEPLSDLWYRRTSAAAEPARPKKEPDQPPATNVASPVTEPAQYSKRPASAYFAGRAIWNQEVQAAFTDLERETIADGIEDFEKMLSGLVRAAELKGAKVGLMFIPTKVQIFYEYLDDLDIYQQIPVLKKMAIDHRAIEDRLAAHMDRIGMKWTSAKPQLIAAIEEESRKGGWVFAPTAGHPNPPGYTAYAKAAIELYRRMAAE